MCWKAWLKFGQGQDAREINPRKTQLTNRLLRKTSSFCSKRLIFYVNNFSIFSQFIKFYYFIYFYFSIRLSGCPKAYFGLLTRKQSHSPDVDHWSLSSSTRKSMGTYNKVGSQTPVKRISGIRARTLPILKVNRYPTVLLSS